jgi:hypothetical protein
LEHACLEPSEHVPVVDPKYGHAEMVSDPVTEASFGFRRQRARPGSVQHKPKTHARTPTSSERAASDRPRRWSARFGSLASHGPPCRTSTSARRSDRRRFDQERRPFRRRQPGPPRPADAPTRRPGPVQVSKADQANPSHEGALDRDRAHEVRPRRAAPWRRRSLGCLCAIGSPPRGGPVVIRLCLPVAHARLGCPPVPSSWI